MVHASIFYSGTVQGVGFRYTTQRYAREFGLKGWVKNLSDDRVEIMVEGSRETIEHFTKRLDEHFKDFITRKEINFGAAVSDYKDFHIAYS